MECPDLIPFDVNGERLWVLLVSMDPGGPIVGSATQYSVGGFDVTKFTNLNLPSKVMWLDMDTDNYAGVTFEKTPLPHLVLISWASNWHYGILAPTSSYRTQMSIPRTRHLVNLEDKEYKLRSYPVKEIDSLCYSRVFKAGHGSRGHSDTTIGLKHFHAINVDLVASFSSKILSR